MIVGSSLIAKCKCGFESDYIYVGGGMFDHDTNCTMPAVCTTCSILFEENIMTDQPIRCPECSREASLYHSDPSLGSKEQSDNTVFDWNFTGNNSHWDSVYLWDTKYYCPECKTIDMRFIHGGIMWD